LAQVHSSITCICRGRIDSFFVMKRFCIHFLFVLHSMLWCGLAAPASVLDAVALKRTGNSTTGINLVEGGAGFLLLSLSMASVYFFGPDMKKQGYKSDSFTNMCLAVIQTFVPGIFGMIEVGSPAAFWNKISSAGCWTIYFAYAITSYVSNVCLMAGCTALGSSLFSLLTSFVIVINACFSLYEGIPVTTTHWMGVVVTTLACLPLPFLGEEDVFSQGDRIAWGCFIAFCWCVDIGLQPYVYVRCQSSFFEETQFPWASITGVFYILIQGTHIIVEGMISPQTLSDFNADVALFMGGSAKAVQAAFLGSIGQAFWAPGMNLLVKGVGAVFSAVASVVCNAIPWILGMVFNGDSFQMSVAAVYIGIVIGNVLYLACDLDIQSFCFSDVPFTWR